MKERFITRTFKPASAALIGHMDDITQQYLADGLDLTLRQLYYRLVAANIVPNTQKSYSKIGNLLKYARLAGLIDWSAIVDRERNLESVQVWDSPQQILSAAAYGLKYDHWLEQSMAVEVWVEKKALIGVVQRACATHRVSRIACKGYMSLSEMHSAAKRIMARDDEMQDTTILYLGDHDPSGLDMPRDIADRLATFGVGSVTVERIALTRDQIRAHDAQPNPVKMTDSRADAYRAEHGDVSWELDALEPSVLVSLIADAVADLVDQDIFDATVKRERRDRERIRELGEGFE